MATIALLAGARPNYMKVFPIWQALKASSAALVPRLIHTGQHYDKLMSDIFFTEFGLPAPDHFLGVGSGSHATQTAKVMTALEKVFETDRPDALVVVGDVNSTVAGALVATKMHIPVAHVEAGLRSRDRTMPEELNRLVTDAISDYLLTPSADADENLRQEGIPPEKIILVGNVMIDSLVCMLSKAGDSSILDDFGVEPRAYVAVTLHRPANVDDPARLRRLLDQLNALAERQPVICPLHPRTAAVMATFDPPFDPHAGLRFAPPLGYLDFLQLQSQAALVITDSGGIQEETSFLGIPCLTVRPNTERPITITMGTNELIDVGRMSLVDKAAEAIARRPDTPPTIPLWDGHAAERIVPALERIVGC